MQPNPERKITMRFPLLSITLALLLVVFAGVAHATDMTAPAAPSIETVKEMSKDSRVFIDFSRYSCADLIKDSQEKRQDVAVYVLMLKVYHMAKQGETRVDLDEKSMSAWGERLGQLCVEKDNANKAVIALLGKK